LEIIAGGVLITIFNHNYKRITQNNEYFLIPLNIHIAAAGPAFCGFIHGNFQDVVSPPVSHAKVLLLPSLCAITLDKTDRIIISNMFDPDEQQLLSGQDRIANVPARKVCA
jgi:hypothetical protein